MSWTSLRCRINSRSTTSPSKQLILSPDNIPSTSRSVSRNSAIAKGLRDSQGDRSERRRHPSNASLTNPRYGHDRYEHSTHVIRRSKEAASSVEKQSNQDRYTRVYIGAANFDSANLATSDAPTKQHEIGRSRVKQIAADHPAGGPGNNVAKSSSLPEPIPYTTASSVFVVGARGVIAALRSRRRQCYRLYILSDLNTSNELKYKHVLHDRKLEIEDLARDIGVRAERVDLTIFLRLLNEANKGHKAQDSPHNGVILEASPIPSPAIRSLDSVHSRNRFAVDRAHQSAEDAEIHGRETMFPFNSHGWRRPFLLWLHGVLDSNNAGAMIRTATYFGADGVLLSGRETTKLTPGTIRSAVGAADYIPIFVATESATQFIRLSQTKGWKFIASVAPNAGNRFETVAEMKNSPLMDDPTVLIMGSEFAGLDKGLISLADRRLSVSGKSDLADLAGVDSLNVSVAAALLMERLLRKPTLTEQKELAKISEERLF